MNTIDSKIHQTKSGYPLASFEDVFNGDDEMGIKIRKEVNFDVDFYTVLSFDLVTSGNMSFEYYDGLRIIHQNKLGKALYYIGVALMHMSLPNVRMTLSANNYVYSDESDGWVKG